MGETLDDQARHLLAIFGDGLDQQITLEEYRRDRGWGNPEALALLYRARDLRDGVSGARYRVVNTSDATSSRRVADIVDAAAQDAGCDPATADVIVQRTIAGLREAGLIVVVGPRAGRRDRRED